jgi:hypothetical protein
VTLPADRLWKRDYAASVRRLVRDGVDTPLANLFVTAARPIPPEAEGAKRARSASEAFLYRRLERCGRRADDFKMNADLPMAFDGWGRMEIDCCALNRDLSLTSTAHSISRIRSRTGVTDAKISYCKTAISCCVISPRTWPRSWTRCSTGFCDR